MKSRFKQNCIWVEEMKDGETIIPVFDHGDPLMSDQQWSPNPIRYVLRQSQTVTYIGAFFQFTPNDRRAWNELVLHKKIPKPVGMSYKDRGLTCLGAAWARANCHLPDDFWTGRESIFDED
jgi:hypothetical protein